MNKRKFFTKSERFVIGERIVTERKRKRNVFCVRFVELENCRYHDGGIVMNLVSDRDRALDVMKAAFKLKRKWMESYSNLNFNKMTWETNYDEGFIKLEAFDDSKRYFYSIVWNIEKLEFNDGEDDDEEDYEEGSCF